MIPLLTPEDRRAKEAVLQMAQLQRDTCNRVIARLRAELGLAPKEVGEVATTLIK